jgi:hypothetical protein
MQLLLKEEAGQHYLRHDEEKVSIRDAENTCTASRMIEWVVIGSFLSVATFFIQSSAL